MTMKLVQLPLHLTPDEALTLLDFLGRLQDLLWASYGAQIQQHAQVAHATRTAGDSERDFDDPLPF